VAGATCGRFLYCFRKTRRYDALQLGILRVSALFRTALRAALVQPHRRHDHQQKTRQRDEQPRQVERQVVVLRLVAQPTSQRRSDQVGDSLHQQQQAVGVCEPIESDQFHQYDARQRVVGRDEEPEGTGNDAEVPVVVDERHQGGHGTAQPHAHGVDYVRVGPTSVAGPTQDHLKPHLVQLTDNMKVMSAQPNCDWLLCSFYTK
jgi:hypothetical protein